jgi:Ni/Co efflux regulator RcnB
MRKFIFSILLAGAAATPALAQDQGDRGRSHQDADAQETREERHQAREERAASQAEQRQQVRQERAAPQIEVHQQVQSEPRQHFDRSQIEHADAPQVEGPRPAQSLERGSRDGRGAFGGRLSEQTGARQDGGWNRDRASWNRGESGDLRQSDRAIPNVMRTRNPLAVDQAQRQGAEQQLREQGHRRSNWNTNWRSDHRYDWHRYRDYHRSTFHLGLYYDPFGYGYQPFDIGYRLFPNYYRRQYWIDSAMYQLPYPPPGTEWIRYWNDALLVDTYTGEVVDVIHNFFW